MPAYHHDVNIRLLVVEDDPVLSTIYRSVFTRNGYEIVIADSLADASLAIEADRFDAALIDLLLPDGSGLDVLREIRQHPSIAHIPVVISTAGSDERNLETAIQQGANRILFKFQNGPKQVVEAMEACLGHRQDPRATVQVDPLNSPPSTRILHDLPIQRLQDICTGPRWASAPNPRVASIGLRPTFRLFHQGTSSPEPPVPFCRRNWWSRASPPLPAITSATDDRNR